MYVHESSCSRTVTQFRYLTYDAMTEKKNTESWNLRVPTYRILQKSQYSKHNGHCKFILAMNRNQIIAYTTAALLELMYLTIALYVTLKSSWDVFAGEKSIERVRYYRIPCVPYMQRHWSLLLTAQSRHPLQLFFVLVVDASSCCDSDRQISRRDQISLHVSLRPIIFNFFTIQQISSQV